ncbi:MAG: tetratricopeptide repeat protein [Salinivirgaceae bacterium]|jgi:tetratricopeptide (TPR) repeat protein|nr:tetratricopeptide repeat protein [Salinivirgaceae bacterium]
MSKKVYIPVIVSIMLMLAACSTKSEQEVLKTSITEKEKEIGDKLSKRTINREEAKELLDCYEEFVNQFPDDTTSAGYLMKAGQQAMSHNMMGKAIKYFSKVEQNYKQTSHYPMAIFMKAFVYDMVGDTKKARNYYERFISEYPNHKLANDARISIGNLGKSLDEIVKDFETKKE